MTPHPLTLDGLLALCEKATPGPWRSTRMRSGHDEAVFFDHDAIYVCALSPEVVAALVRAVQAADAMRATLPNIPRTQHGCIARRAEFDVARAALDAAMRGKG